MTLAHFFTPIDVLTPSGGPYDTSTWWRKAYVWVSEAPLPSHIIGGWLAVLVEWLRGLHGFEVWAGAAILCFVWQLAKWNDEVYGKEAPRQVFWREVIGIVGAAMPILYFGL